MTNAQGIQQPGQLLVWDYPISDLYTTLWKAIQTAEMPNTDADGIQKVLNSGENGISEFALMSDANFNRYAAMTDCRLKSVGNEFSRKPYAIAVQSGSKLRDEISAV